MLSNDFHKNGPFFFIIIKLRESQHLFIFKTFDTDFFVLTLVPVEM